MEVAKGLMWRTLKEAMLNLDSKIIPNPYVGRYQYVKPILNPYVDILRAKCKPSDFTRWTWPVLAMAY